MDRWNEDDRAYMERMGWGPPRNGARVLQAAGLRHPKDPDAWDVGNFVVFQELVARGTPTTENLGCHLALVWGIYTSPASKTHPKRAALLAMNPEGGTWHHQDVPIVPGTTRYRWPGIHPTEKPEIAGEVWMALVRMWAGHNVVGENGEYRAPLWLVNEARDMPGGVRPGDLAAHWAQEVDQEGHALFTLRGNVGIRAHIRYWDQPAPHGPLILPSPEELRGNWHQAITGLPPRARSRA